MISTLSFPIIISNSETKKNQNCIIKQKTKSSDVVHSVCTGLCVTVELYSLPAWRAGAVNNNNIKFLVVVCGPLCKNVV